MALGYRDAVLASRPFCYWPMDERAGTVGRNLVPGGPAITYGNGPIFGKPGPVAASPGSTGYDGSADYASAAVDFGSSSVVTWECWFWQNAFGSGDNLMAEHSGNYNSNSGVFILDPNSASTGQFDIGIHSTARYDVGWIPRPSAGRWHHLVVCFFEGGSPILEAYVDGVKQTVTITLTQSTTGGFQSFTLYMMSRAGSSLFNAGRLAHVALYKRRLTAAEIRRHYTAARPVGRRRALAYC